VPELPDPPPEPTALSALLATSAGRTAVQAILVR
jgi:hypothetical protein